MYKNLFSEGKINGVTLKNRIVMPPMCPGMADCNGDISSREIKYLEARAKGGCGLIIPGYITIMGPEGSGVALSKQTQLKNNENKAAIAVLVEAIHNYDAKIFIQLVHPGRMASPADNNGNMPVSCSATSPMPGIMPVARELTKEEIQTIVREFGRAAAQCVEAGADGVEIHGAHGYLVSQFLSPHTNLRTDEYGGSLENRLRFAVEIIEEVRRNVPGNYPVLLRINADDGEPGGVDLELAVKNAEILSRKGIDALDISMGGIRGVEPPSVAEGAKRDYVKAIKAVVDIPVLSTSHIKSPKAAEKLLADGIQDFVCIGRAQIADPEFANKAKAGKDEEIKSCISCNYCMQNAVFQGMQLRCSVNPRAGKEIDYPAPAADGNGKTIAIIGAGPGGLEAAKLAAEKGYKVTIFEKESKIGGALQLAGKAPSKGEKIANLITYYEKLIKRYGIDLRLNTQITDLAVIKALNPSAVVLASGGKQIIPHVPGIDSKRVCLAYDVLNGSIKIEEKKVVIIGAGLTGLETADLLALGKNEIAVYDMLPAVFQGIPFTTMVDLSMRFQAAGVGINTSHKLKEIKDKEVVFTNLTNNEEVTKEADVIILALGVANDFQLYNALKKEFGLVINVGDSCKPGKIKDATAAGYGKIYVL